MHTNGHAPDKSEAADSSSGWFGLGSVLGQQPEHGSDGIPTAGKNGYLREAGYGAAATNELSTMRLDIADIQDAIKNHDLWVQDAAHMRSDIEALQAGQQDHELWMSKVTRQLQQMQEKELALERELSILRRPSIGSGPNLDGSYRDIALTNTESTTLPTSAIDDIQASISKQINRALLTLKAMVSTAEEGLVKQLESERAARRAAVMEARREIATFARSVEAGSAAASGGVQTTDVKAGANPAVEATLTTLQLTVQSLERETQERLSQADARLNEFKGELTQLRAEQQLQALSSGPLAISTSSLQSTQRNSRDSRGDGRVRSRAKADDLTFHDMDRHRPTMPAGESPPMVNGRIDPVVTW
mmetsp:Transcript_45049/g.107033  ORF Transcript_45049/g.107033 Transcript_45049/m.107033 type:complete len:361 (-) Transcript_45049:33-1115(-)